MINCHSSFSSGQENHSMVTSLSSSFLSCQRQGSIYEIVCCYDRLQERWLFGKHVPVRNVLISKSF